MSLVFIIHVLCVVLCSCLSGMCVLTCMYVCVRQRNDGLWMTYLNRPNIIASPVIRGASLRIIQVSAYEDDDMRCNNMDIFPFCYYSFLWNIAVLHVEAITLRA